MAPASSVPMRLSVSIVFMERSMPRRRDHPGDWVPVFRTIRRILAFGASRTNADDCLPLGSLGRVEGGDGVVEGRDVADVRLQSSVPYPLDDCTQLGTIGLDDE